MAFLLKDQPALFGQFQAGCASGNLPDYRFIEPNYTDHAVGNGTVPAADQHPDHNVLAGEEFIALVYMSILNNEDLWNSTLLLVVYDDHGGIMITPRRRPVRRMSSRIYKPDSSLTASLFVFPPC